MKSVEGFEFEGERIVLIEPRGKDVSFPRWRVIGYYAPRTLFFDSQAEYDSFLADVSSKCLSADQYVDWRDGKLEV